MTTLKNGDIERMPAGQIKDLAKRGIIRLVTTLTKPMDRVCYTDLPQYKKHARWKGVKITVREASRLYKLPANTISQWTTRGLISVLERTEREIYLDRADVAYCAEIRAERQGSGHWLFNADRTPYVPTTRPRT